MTVVNKAEVNALMRALQGEFQGAVQTTESDQIEQVSMNVPINTDNAKFPVGALLGDLEEVLDEVVVQDIGAWVQRVDVRTFAKATEISVDDIADDQIGVYRPIAQRLGRRAELYPLRLLAEAFVNGYTTDWIDGDTVFNTSARDWPAGSDESFTNQDDVTLSETQVYNFMEVMESRVGPSGAPLGLEPTHLICGPARRAAAEEILDQQNDDAGASNPLYQRLGLVVLPRIQDEKWGLVDADPIEPMVLLDRSGPSFVSLTDSETEFYQEEVAFKGRRRCAAEILAPWLFQVSNHST